MVRQPGDHLADPSSLLLRMGSRLRARRRELGRTLAEVAGPADVSVSYLSAVEKGTNQPSLQVLVRIVHALDLRIADVLRAEGQNHVRVATVADAAPGGKVISHAGLQLEIVALTARPGDAGACPVTLDERDLAVVVHRGAIVVSVDGEDHELHTADALDARLPGAVVWRVLGDEPATTIWTSGRALTAGI